MRAPNILEVGAAAAANVQNEARHKKIKSAFAFLDGKAKDSEAKATELQAGLRAVKREVASQGAQLNKKLAPLAAYVNEQQLAASLETRRREVRELDDAMHDEFRGEIGAMLTRERDFARASIEALYRNGLKRAEEKYVEACHALNRRVGGAAYNDHVGELTEERDRERDGIDKARDEALETTNARYDQRSDEADEALNAIQGRFDEVLIGMRSTDNIVMSVRENNSSSAVATIENEFAEFHAAFAKSNDPIAKAFAALYSKAPGDVTDKDLDALWRAYNNERRAAYESVKAQFQFDFG